MSLARDLLGTEELRHPLRVWYHNGEDPEDEINRRIAAICIHFELDEQEVRKNLYVTCGLDMPIKVARGATEVKLDKALIGEITARIGDHSIDVAIFDPLVTVHSTSELLAATMDPVIREAFGFIANETNSAVELAHHTRKKAPGQDEYTAAAPRGVKNITVAGCCLYTVARIRRTPRRVAAITIRQSRDDHCTRETPASLPSPPAGAFLVWDYLFMVAVERRATFARSLSSHRRLTGGENR